MAVVAMPQNPAKGRLSKKRMEYTKKWLPSYRSVRGDAAFFGWAQVGVFVERDEPASVRLAQ